MEWLSALDWSHWHQGLAQTPAPSPQVELLTNQLEFLKAENARLSADFTEKLKLITDESKTLSESFTRFVTTMQFVLVVFGFLGGVIAFVFKQNLDDAREVAARMISQEIERRVAAIADQRIEIVKRSLLREEVIGSTLVDYYLPALNQPQPEVELLRSRGFQEVRFQFKEQDWRRSRTDVLVLDLVHWRDQSGQLFAELPEDSREQQASELATQLLNILPQTSALVIYVPLPVKSLNRLPRNRYAALANVSITLIGMVADAAYVTHGARGRA